MVRPNDLAWLEKCEKIIFLVRNFCPTPRNSLHGQKFLPRRAFCGVKISWIFTLKSPQNPKRGKKIHSWVSEDFLGPKVTTPQIWGSAEVSAVLGVFLKICSCQLFFKKKFSHFLLLFFPIFFQKWSKSKGQ